MVMYGNIKRVDMKEITKEIKDYLLSVGYPDKEKIFYLEAWLWLWREKKLNLYTKFDVVSRKWTHNARTRKKYFSDPEEAIISAIEKLVDNDLIK